MKNSFLYLFFISFLFSIKTNAQEYFYVSSKRVELFERINKYLAKYDFNNDGLDDLLVGGENLQTLEKTKILLLINNGDGTFSDSTSKFINGKVVANSPVATSADFNNDGILDIAIFDAGNLELGQDPILTGFYGETPMLLISQNGKRLWDVSDALGKAISKVTNYPTNGDKLHLKHANVGDINNDGLVDIFVESGGGYKQPLDPFFINQGNGQFIADAGRIDQSILVGPNFQWRYDNNYLVDINNDGYLDLAMGNLRRKYNRQDDMYSIVIINDKKGFYKKENVINLPRPNFNESWGYARSIKPYDFNKDGYQDLLIMFIRSQDSSSKYAFTGTYFQALINKKGSAFIDSTDTYIKNNQWMTAEINDIFNTPNKNEPNDIEFVDMNNDGYKDLYMIKSWDMSSKHMPIIMLNNGSNYFEPIDSNKISRGNKYVGMQSINIDLNNDKLSDILFLDTYPGKDDKYGTVDDYEVSAPIFSNSVPVIIDTIFNYKEKQPSGTKIGNLNIKDLNDKKHLIKVSGTGANNIKVDSLGNIYTNDSTYFTYQNNKAIKILVEVADNFTSTKSNITINIICQPDKPTFSNTNFLVCSPDSLKLELKNTQSSDSIFWYLNGKLDKINQPNLYVKEAIESVYISRITNLGCKINSDTIRVAKSQRPNTPIINRDNDNNLVANTNSITWYKDGVKIADTTQKIKPTSNGNYTATTTQNGCTSLASANYYYLTSAVANLSGDEYFKVSPNPTDGEIYLNYNIRSTKDVYVNVVDMTGRTIISNTKVNNGSKLNLGSSMKGNYIIQVKDKTGRLLTTEKLIKN